MARAALWLVFVLAPAALAFVYEDSRWMMAALVLATFLRQAEREQCRSRG